jgi:hypothetical protein
LQDHVVCARHLITGATQRLWLEAERFMPSALASLVAGMANARAVSKHPIVATQRVIILFLLERSKTHKVPRGPALTGSIARNNLYTDSQFLRAAA